MRWGGGGWLRFRRIAFVRAAAPFVLLFSFALPQHALASSCAWNRVCPYQGVEVFGGTNTGSLQGPLGVAWTPSGNVALADFGHQTLTDRDLSGTLIAQVGAADRFAYLHAVAVDRSSGEIAAAEAACVDWFKPNGSDDGHWCLPFDPSHSNPQIDGIVAGPDETTYVAEYDWNGPRIDVFNSSHQRLSSWSVALSVSDAFAVDSQGDVYMPGWYSAREYDASGNILGTIPLTVAPNALSIYGSTLYVAPSANPAVGGAASLPELVPYDLSGNAAGPPIPVPNLGPAGSAPVPVSPQFDVGPDGIIAATTNRTVEHVGLDGTLEGSWGGLAANDYEPTAAFEDASGNVYVMDFATGNDRIIKYDAQRDPPAVLADLSSYFAGLGAPLASMSQDSQGNFVIDSWNSVVTVNENGNVLRHVTLSCKNGCTDVAVDPTTGDLYAVDFAALDKFAPDGTIISSWPVQTRYVAVDSAGNVYVDGNRQTIDKYSSSGQRLASWRAGGNFEPVTPGSLSVDAHGYVYATAMDGIHIYSPSGTMVAVWPFANTDPGAITVSPNGDVLVSIAPSTAGSAPGTQVYRYYDLRDPLPPVPPADESPLAASLRLTLGPPAEPDTKLVKDRVRCSNPVHPGFIAAKCVGTVTLTLSASRARSTRAQRPATLGSARFSVALRHTQNIRIWLDRHARKLLARLGRLSVTLTLVYRTGLTSTTLRRRIELHSHLPAPRKAARRRVA